jgi:hypothetical protein
LQVKKSVKWSANGKKNKKIFFRIKRHGLKKIKYKNFRAF